jgi:molybdopterin-guanine dinucleotide biosynthesis protein A
MTRASSEAAPLGLVLVGGLARRMGGGDKARIRVAGKTILERVLACLKPQCAAVILNANGDPTRFADTSLPVVAASVPLACARSGDWRHPVVGLWPVALREDLRKALVGEDMRKIEAWTARHGVAIADWPATPVDPFFNVNTPADAAEAERIAAQQCDV